MTCQHPTVNESQNFMVTGLAGEHVRAVFMANTVCILPVREIEKGASPESHRRN